MRYQITLILLFVICTQNAFTQASKLIFYSENGEMFFLEMDKTNRNQEATYYRRLENVSPSRHDFVLTFADSKSSPIRRSFTPKPGWQYTFLIRKKMATNNKVMTNFHGQPVSIAGITVWGENQEFDVKQISGIKMQTSDPSAYSSAGSQGAERFTGSGSAQPYTYGNPNTISYGGNAPSNVQTQPAYTIICNGTMDQASFEAAIATVDNATFADTKKTVAKQVLDRNCVNAAQARRIVSSFEFEEDRLQMAKYAWHHTADRENYFVVFDAFTFETSIQDLSVYMQNNP